MSTNHKQKFIFFTAELVAFLICVNRNRDCQDVTSSISSQMDKVSRNIKDGDIQVREEQRKYGAAFVEAFQEMVHLSKSFALGQIALIGCSSFFLYFPF